MRLDQYLVERLQLRSRTYAQNLIAENQVLVNDKIVNKPSFQLTDDDTVYVLPQEEEYVSRGAYKLKTALDKFNIDLNDKTVLDIGSSTGGFTDICLQRGARMVYAVDVGKDQMVDKLKADPRVILMEGTDFRLLDKTIFPNPIDFLCCDVSFISSQKILSKIADLQFDNCDIIILIKPQFEVGQAFINKHGVVKNLKKVETMLLEYYDFALNKNFKILDIVKSGITGKEGNQEYLLYLTNKTSASLNVSQYQKRIL